MDSYRQTAYKKINRNSYKVLKTYRHTSPMRETMKSEREEISSCENQPLMEKGHVNVWKFMEKAFSNFNSAFSFQIYASWLITIVK